MRNCKPKTRISTRKKSVFDECEEEWRRFEAGESPWPWGPAVPLAESITRIERPYRRKGGAR